MPLRRMNLSVIGLTDSYKVTHHLQYHPDLTHLISYWESRGGRFKETVAYGFFYYLDEYLSVPVTLEDIRYWAERWGKHFFGNHELFNEEGWLLMLEEYNGLLPIRIRAVPEGTVVPTGNVLMTIENTDERFPWVTNYVETMLCHMWYPSTVATLSREAKKIITRYAKMTGADLAGVPFKLHDFGFRGVSSLESAAVGGSAHLVNFVGTDTAPGFEFAKAYYGEDMAGFSIPAAEHSTITSWGGPEHEIDAFRNMVEQFGDCGIFAVVSDSYDIFNAAENLWGGELFEEVMRMPSTLVVRPDSGDVLTVVKRLMEILASKFGTTETSTGHKVLNKVRVIQGDGMNLDMIEAVCAMLHAEGWSIDNIAFGMGGGLLQQVNRDTSKYAFKASAAIIDGVEIDVWKDPITDPGKTSKRGRLSLRKNLVNGDLYTADWYTTPEDLDVLQVIWENGHYVGTPPTFAEIRQRAAVL